MPEQPGMAVGERRGLALPGRSVAGGWGHLGTVSPWAAPVATPSPCAGLGSGRGAGLALESTEGTWPVWGWPCWGVTDSIKTS